MNTDADTHEVAPSTSRSRAELAIKYQRIIIWIFILGSLVGMYGPTMLQSLRYASETWTFNDDARQQIWPLLRYRDPTLFQDDEIADRILASLPVGYKLFYWCTSRVLDPRPVSKVLPYCQFLIFLGSVAVVCWRLGGPLAGWSGMALCFSSAYIFSRLGGGLPRSFAFPILGWAVVAMVWGRPWLLAGLTLVGAAFYASIGFLVGLCLAIYLLCFPASSRGEASDWPWRRRVGVVSGTAVVCMAILLPTAIQLRPYGPMIRPSQVAQYPEAGIGGRYGQGDHPPFDPYLQVAQAYTFDMLVGPGKPWSNLNKPIRQQASLWLTVVLLASLWGLIQLARHHPHGKRFLILVPASMLAYTMADWVTPYLWLPTRYASYPTAVFLVMAIPVGAVACGRFLEKRFSCRWLGHLVTASVLSMVIFGLGTRGLARSGYTIRIARQAPLYPLFEQLPKDALVAGWPQGPIDNLPYISQTRIFIGYETHQVVLSQYVLKMRERMNALIDAYFAVDLEPLLALHRQFGVTHLLIDTRHLGPRAPSYFKPFEKRIQRKHAALKNHPHAIVPYLGKTRVFQCDFYVLVDLQKLADEVSQAPTVKPLPMEK